MFPASPVLLPHLVQEAYSSVGMRPAADAATVAAVVIVVFLLAEELVVVGGGGVCGRCESWRVWA